MMFWRKFGLLRMLWALIAAMAVTTADVQASSEPGAATSTAYAAERQALAEAQRQIGDLTADFSLTVQGQGTGPKSGAWKARGKISLATGRRYRVEYSSPEVQWLVSDGKQRCLYLKKINQVQKQALPPAGNPSEFFLELGGGLAELLKRCQITRMVKQAVGSGRWEYDCVPNPGETLEFQRARIWVDGPLKLPVRVEIEAAKSVTVELKRVKVHTRAELQAGKAGLPESLFQFTPPAGAEVIEPLWP
jgi:outer membrane lipoprotein-sorting protein